jgi:hypothetical protein
MYVHLCSFSIVILQSAFFHLIKLGTKSITKLDDVLQHQTSLGPIFGFLQRLRSGYVCDFIWLTELFLFAVFSLNLSRILRLLKAK